MAIDTNDTSDAAASTFIGWLTATARALGYNRDSDLARALQVDQSVVSRWRKGSQPSVKHLAKVSDLTGTQLVPLLVLAGYLHPSRARHAKAPQPTSTPGERLISESSLPDELKNEVRDFWGRRMREERTRLLHLLEIIEQTADGKMTSDKIREAIAARVFVSDLSNQVTDLLDSSADAVDRIIEREESLRKESPDAREEGAQAANPREP